MRWIVRRKAAWAFVAWLSAVGLAPADPVPKGEAKPRESIPATRSVPTELPPTSVTAPPADGQPAPPTGGRAAPPPVADGCTACESIWAKVPPVATFPRLGYFLVPPTDAGAYSFADLLNGTVREKPPANPYPPTALAAPSFFDADYRYLDKPDNTQHDFFDVLKRMHPTPDTMVTVGGQHSVRYMKEGYARLGQGDNTYTLYRNRAYADLWYRDQVRVYGEFIQALIDGQELAPLPIDENRGDILNLFVDLKVGDINGNGVYVRAGRQELLYGSQRLISTLDWANTRRTFEGVKAFWHSETLDVDAFWVRPVVIKPGDLDSANHDVDFYGAWLTYRPAKGQFIDLYYLGLSDDAVVRDRFAPPGLPAHTGTQDVHTVGARYAGNQGPVLFDFEGMAQFGDVVGRDHRAYAYTAQLGYVFESVPWKPQVWASYDYASGTADPATGDDHTFSQLFPFGHYYLGYLDLVARQNIQDVSFQFACYPQNWITLQAQYHCFRLAEARDFLYNAGGRPTRRDPTGAAGRDVGNEVDLLANFHLSQHSDVLVGYSKLFAGDFIKRTRGGDVSPDLFYVMYNFRW